VTCARANDDGSACGDDAHWRPALLIYPAPGAAHLRVEIGIALCDRHRAATGDDVLTDEAWGQVAGVIEARGGRLPRRDLTEIAFDPIA
jgi:hypothetical protein